MAGRRVVQLATDRRLLRPDFEGYRLASADSASAVVRAPLPRGALKPPRPPVDARSLLHARLYALHNALFRDPHSAGAYFLDADGSIWRSDLKLAAPAGSRRGDGEDDTAHPPSLAFLDGDRALLADGSAGLTVYRTGDRRLEEPPAWREEAALVVGRGERGFTLLDARPAAGGAVHCLLYRVGLEETPCAAHIEWLVLEERGGAWAASPYRRIVSRGVVHYCALEPGCGAVLVAGDRPATFLDRPETAPTPEPAGERRVLYSWTQNAEELTVTVPLSAGRAPVVESDGTSLKVRDGETVPVGGELFAEVDGEVTTWSTDGAGNLSVCLQKRQPGAAWPSLMKGGDAHGERATDPTYAAEVHTRLAHLCSETEIIPGENLPLFNSQQLEECDFSSVEEACLLRLSGENYETTHQTFLNSNPFVLDVSLDPLQARALGLRHDADTCVWQPYQATDNIWPIRHEGTLLAFGYVQSSKQQKKFSVCSPNFKYGVVCEATRHAFIYQQDWAPDQKLRQRNSSGEKRRINVGKQQLISFERDEEVLGVCATDETLFILTCNSMITMDMTD